ncbi:MAG: extracellular solute-binding protein [Moorea sp. SIO3B2]|nr:extracellular solute-binding protein [Moorena sp. SIO3B2]NEP69115.1 extracellular solute-binding protein [Moorena sp. SIO3A5]NEQ06039.1 extracellular solute-binding protein [Moorena sp. SIO4E2]NER91087.1 extracellular solute-binding protein [Moorena sp. SIO3A2]
MLFLGACMGKPNLITQQRFEVKFLVGSALGQFCEQAAEQFNQQQPKLANGKGFSLSCDTKSSSDVVTSLTSLAQQLKSRSLKRNAPEFPSLVSVDGEIHHRQLIDQINQIFPGRDYIGEITDAPLLAQSPMVFMTSAELADGLRQQPDLYKALVNTKTHQELDPKSPQLPIHLVHTAPTGSNSGLQTLVVQFASVSGKRPEQLTVADVQRYQTQIQGIQSKVIRYGVSSSSLAKDMVKNGSFWASIGSVYESSVIAANSHQQAGQSRYQAVYPQATFTSNMRAILPKAPWVSRQEKAAGQQVIDYLRSPQVQKIATELGLRPGVPEVPLGAKFSAQFGVDSKARYDSLSSPQPEVVAAMVKSWQEFAKKPSQVVVLVNSSGSMSGNKLAAVQKTLRAYIESLGPTEQIALIDFDSEIRPPVLVDSTPQKRDRAMAFILNLNPDGGNRLYDAALEARNWLQKNYQERAINAVVILTDGDDSDSKLRLEQLSQELEKSGFSSDNRIAFFTIGYGNEGEFNPKVLEQIAEFNWGYYRQGDPSTILNLMADLKLEF